MNDNYRKLLEMPALNDIPVDDLPGWVAENAIWYLDSDNVGAILGLLGRAKGTANLAFWATVNAAPTCDERWAELHLIGSGVTEEMSERHMKQYRIAVELARAYVGEQQLRRDQLFQPGRQRDSE